MVMSATESSDYYKTQPRVNSSKWIQKRLVDLIDFENGKGHEQFIAEHGKFKVINSKFISTDGAVVKYSNVALALLRRGDLTLVMSDVPNGRALARCFMVDLDDTYTLNQRICCLRPKFANGRFLYYLLNRNKYFLDFDSGTGQTNLRRQEVLDCPLEIPESVDEQANIATALSDTDALISSLEKLIEKKRNIKQGAMQELLTGKRRLPGFSGATVSGTLGELFVARPKRKQLSPFESVVFLGMEDISSGGGLLNQTVIPFNQVRNGLTPFERDDILVAKITPCFENGKGAFLSNLKTKVGFGSTEFHVLRATADADPRYIYFHTQTAEFRRTLEGEMIGTAGQKRVPIAAIEKYPLTVKHTLPEQQAISTILAEMDSEIDALQSRLLKVRGLKQGMMQNLLTGKIRLI